MRSLVALALVAGCSDGGYTVITVGTRPAVHGATKLKVTLTNEGSMRTDELDLAGHAFPVTFSITAPGRTGDLIVDIDALDMGGALVGRGAGTTAVGADAATVVLDSADFVVNTDVANDQFVTDDFEAVGLQLAVGANNTWMVGYRDSPCSGCNIFGRRYDATGVPASSAIAAGPNAFPITTTQTTSGAQVAVASDGSDTLAFWDYQDTSGGAEGVACRRFDPTGAALPSQISIATDTLTDVVSATGLSNQNIAVAWNAPVGTNGLQVIRTIFVRSDCTSPLTAPITVSTALGSFGARRGHLAANGMNVLYAWIVDGKDVHVRVYTNGLAALTNDTTLITHTATQQVDHVRVAPSASGFVVAARWSTTSGSGPGKIELYRVDKMGTQMGQPTLITDKSGSDFASDKAFGLASRPDGAVMVVWHQCDNGPGTCDVFGRVVHPSGTVEGDPFNIATTTQNDQVNPSIVALPPDAFVAAWNDSSGSAPDPSGTAVRARVLYPSYDPSVP